MFVGTGSWDTLGISRLNLALGLEMKYPQSSPRMDLAQ